MANSLFQFGLKYARGTEERLDSKWGSVYSIVETKDTATVINNWIKSITDLERLWSLIKLPFKILKTLKRVEIDSSPRTQKPLKPKPPKSANSGQEIWKEGDGICWECFGVVLLRPRKSLKELRQSKNETWTIKPI